jgi:hypothetical protein
MFPVGDGCLRFLPRQRQLDHAVIGLAPRRGDIVKPAHQSSFLVAFRLIFEILDDSPVLFPERKHGFFSVARLLSRHHDIADAHK